MIKIALIILFFIPAMVYSQLYGKYEVGLINDSDGYILVRNGQGTNSSAVDTIFEKEFFQFLPNDTSEWYKVFRWEIEGFVHKSRIQNIKKLHRESQNKLLNDVFDRKKACYSGTYQLEKGGVSKTEKFHLDTFNPILDMFILFETNEYDEMLMRKFIDLLILNSGSADENPPTALGYIYLAQSEHVIELLNEYDNYMLNSMLDLGFANATFGVENEIENYNYLKNQLSKLFIDK